MSSQVQIKKTENNLICYTRKKPNKKNQTKPNPTTKHSHNLRVILLKAYSLIKKNTLNVSKIGSLSICESQEEIKLKKST